jgi:uncharacterized protein (PEP-CTERM system associated)
MICKKNFLFLVIVICVLTYPALSNAIEYKIEPAINLGEEYHDNILLDDENKVDDYVTRVRPSVKFKYTAPRWEWDVFYKLDFRYYANRTIKDDTTHDLDAKGNIEVLNEFFFIDLTDR